MAFITYAEITATKIHVMGGKTSALGRKTSALGRNTSALFSLPLAGEKCKRRSIVLVANVMETAIRVADINVNPPKNYADELMLAVRKQSSPTRWELVNTHFPIGEKMNGNTHNFDGVVVGNKHTKRYVMAALPNHVAENISKTGAELFGNSIKRLDTVECILFRYFAKKNIAEPYWVIFPQGDGFRILYLCDGLPRAAWRISNHPQFRQAEMIRYLTGSLVKPAPPDHARIKLMEIGEFNTFKTQEEDKPTPAPPPTLAIMLTGVGRDQSWMFDFFANRNIAILHEEYDLQRYLMGRK